MFSNKEGQKLPNAPIRVKRDGQWQLVQSQDLFAGKTVVVFSLPGAFTPTCSSAHVPRYNELQPTLAKHGVDEIYCVSVNDSFVMDAWHKDQAADRVGFLADGNGEFTEAMGLLVDKSQIGFGKRSWRYSMLVRDNVIEKMFIEPQKDGDPFEVSDADTMLKQVAPTATPVEVLMFSKPGCRHCTRAKTLLESQGLDYEEVPASPRRLKAVSKTHTTPQIFINGDYIGGADQLEEFFAAKAK